MKELRIGGFTDRNGTTFLPSQMFLHDNGSSALVACETGGTVFLDKELTDAILKEDISDDFWFLLIQRGLARTGDAYAAAAGICGTQRVTYFILDISGHCNMNCAYCFREHTNTGVMSDEVFDAACRKIAECCRIQQNDSISVQLWGGEPFMYPERLFRMSERLRSMDLRVSIDVETNGTLVTSEIARRAYSLGLNMGISVDGDASSHNAQRPFANGAPSYDAVKRGIDNLAEYYGKGSLSSISIVTKLNMDNIRKMLGSMVYNLGLSYIKFNIVRDNPVAPRTDLSLSESDVRHFARELFSEVMAYWRMETPVFEDTIITRIRNLLDNSSHNLCNSRSCGGGRRMISISYDGGIYPCEMIDFSNVRLGSVLAKESIPDQLMTAQRTNEFFALGTSAECVDCPWYSHCGGGCVSRRKYIGLTGRDTTECALNQELYPLIINAILEEPELFERLLKGVR